jgi:hypothetical protein
MNPIARPLAIALSAFLSATSPTRADTWRPPTGTTVTFAEGMDE